MTIGSEMVFEPAKSSSGSPEAARPSRAIADLAEALNRASIRYCHWKSNLRLGEALRAETDVDLLVGRDDAARFQSLVAALGYKPGAGASSPSICHYYAVDPVGGPLVHLHVYYRIVTGGTILKNHRLPLEEMLLAGCRLLDGVCVPAKAAELVSFVIRKMLEYATPSEALVLAREGSAVGEELDWLSDGVSEDEVATLLREHLPAVDPDTWRRCRQAITTGSVLRRFVLARTLAARLRGYARYSRRRALWLRASRLLGHLALRMSGARPRDALLTGGAVIAIVGSDGAGKSTIAAELARWLGGCLAVRTIHAGKPPPSSLSLMPRLLLPLLRRLLPRYRTTSLEMESDETATRGLAGLRHRRLFFLYPLRAIMLAQERKRLLLRAHRAAARGALVVSDRYPTLQRGVPEGPALSFLLDDRNAVYAWLARVEERAYRAIPSADLVLHLELPAELACHRNLTRDKPGGPKPTPYIRRRHALTSALKFPGVPFRTVNTTGGVEETLQAVKTIVWNAL